MTLMQVKKPKTLFGRCISACGLLLGLHFNGISIICPNNAFSTRLERDGLTTLVLDWSAASFGGV